MERYAYLGGNRVLEVGSLNVNGGVRDLFPLAHYLGIDLEAGLGVDKRASVGNLEGLLFDTVICLEVLEHDPDPFLTLKGISRVLIPGGILFLSARGATRDGQAMFEHNYPGDYWRFMPQSWRVLFGLAGCSRFFAFDDTQHPGFMGVGQRDPDTDHWHSAEWWGQAKGSSSRFDLPIENR